MKLMHKILIKLFGLILVAISFFYIWKSVDSENIILLYESISADKICFLILLSFVYFLINFIRAVNWTDLICMELDGTNLSRRNAIAVYLKTEIVKYIPSNIMHFAGRQIMMKNHKVGNKITAVASSADIFFVLAASGLAIITGLYIIKIDLPVSYIINSLKFKIALSAIFLIGLIYVWFAIKKKIIVFKFLNPKNIFYIFRIFFFSIFIFLINAFIFTALINYVSEFDFTIKEFIFIWSAYSFCWAAGLLVPGAPGGLGVREALIVIIFRQHYGEAEMVTAGILMRLITIAGDMIALAAGTMLHKNTAKITIRNK